jgi:hypothetical protein
MRVDLGPTHSRLSPKGASRHRALRPLAAALAGTFARRRLAPFAKRASADVVAVAFGEQREGVSNHGQRVR